MQLHILILFAALACIIAAVSAVMASAASNDHNEKNSKRVLHDLLNSNNNNKKKKKKTGNKGRVKTTAGVMDKIEHFIVIEEENRSVDHMLGTYRPKQNPDAWSRTSTLVRNPVSTRNLSMGYINVTMDAPDRAVGDPAHGYHATTVKMFGLKKLYDTMFNDFRALPADWATMDGYVEQELQDGGCTLDNGACGVMGVFAEGAMPVLTELADSFAIGQQFFASVASATWPNRQFSIAATSLGNTDTDNADFFPGNLYPSPTFFDQVADAGGKAVIAVNDTCWEMVVASVAHHPERVIRTSELLQQLRDGSPDLGHFVYVNPRSGINVTTGEVSNDMHPAHRVSAGLEYIKDIYEAARSGPLWNKTAVIILFDEAGGFHDRVVPPAAPAPDDSLNINFPSCHFERLGPRIPFLVASPWIPAGTILNGPPAAQMPQNNSAYEHTSVMATARKMLKVLNGTAAQKPLTRRDAWTATFEHLFSLPEPSNQGPLHLPAATVNGEGGAHRSLEQRQMHARIEAAQPVNDLQRHILRAHSRALYGHDRDDAYRHVKTEGQVSETLVSMFEKHKSKTLAWKKSKTLENNVPHRSNKNDDGEEEEGQKNETYTIGMLPRGLQQLRITSSWLFKYNKTQTQHRSSSKPGFGSSSPAIVVEHERATISTVIDGQRWCLDAGDLTIGAEFRVSHCYPSSNPMRNRDPSQNIMIRQDATIGPTNNASLCMTTHLDQGMELPFKTKMTLEWCKNSMTQWFAYHGKTANPSYGRLTDGSGAIMWGDDTNELVVFKKKL